MSDFLWLWARPT